MGEQTDMCRKFVYVQWVDSTKYGKIHKDDTKKKRRDYIETAGILVNEDEEELTIAMYYNWLPDHYSEDVTIPKEAIKKIRRVKV